MNHHPSLCVLSIYPMIQGFAYILFAGPTNPIDWGIGYIATSNAKRNTKMLSRIEELMTKYQPDAIVIEDYLETRFHRSPRMLRLYRSMTHIAQTKAIDVCRVAKTDVLKCFGTVGAKTKHEIAQAVARQFPEFAHRLPKKRQVWDPQQRTMGLFTAAALAVVFYQQSST